MKRVGNIYPKIIDKNNLLLAIHKASKGKGKRRNVKNVINHMSESVDYLYNILSNETFKPTRGEVMIIHDGTRKKERIIEKPRFYPDQCVHWSLMLQLQPIIMKGMYDFCCASVPGRGVHYMKKHIEKSLVLDRKNTKYALYIDITKFYDSIVIDILKQMFEKRIKDKKTLNLINLILDNSRNSNGIGVPIGNFTSQWFANFYLQEFDHWIKETKKAKYYYRYMDDLLIFGRNKKELHKLKNEIELYLQSIGLKIKSNWQVWKVDARPISFCGFVYHRGYTTMKSKNALRIRRRIKRISKKAILNRKDAGATISYYGSIKHTNSFKFYKKYIEGFVSLEKCKEVIRNEGTKQYKTEPI